jgi:hypothetical protein
MQKPDYRDFSVGTSADWTRGYKAALSRFDDELGDMTKAEREMFMRGYRVGDQDRQARAN